MSWKKTAAIVLGGTLLLCCGVVFYLVFFTTPRMRIQHNIRTFEALMPMAPEASVPMKSDLLPTRLTVPEEQRNLADTAENRVRGEVYYGYYCAFCHGPEGRGEGPVGKSYMPRPADLNTVRTRGMDDDELLRAMLLGTGHEPVINRVVPSEHYGYLMVFIRSFSENQRN